MSTHEKFKKDLTDRTEILYRTNETIQRQLRGVVDFLNDNPTAVDRQALVSLLTILINLLDNEKDAIRSLEEALIETDKELLEALAFKNYIATILSK